MNSQHKGDHSELRVAAELTKLGWTISLPYMEEAKYDLVAEKDAEFVRIQVKSSIYDEGKIHFSCHCSQSAKGAGSSTHYTDEDIDGIAVYNEWTGECYWIPVEDTNEWKMTLNEEADSKNPADEYLLIDTFHD